MPSSFTVVLSRALEYSSRPPVSVCGTGALLCPGAFLGTNFDGTALACAAAPRIFDYRRPSPFMRSSRLNFSGHGILNRVCITYAFRPRLSSRLTLGGRTFPRKPWTYGGWNFHPPCRYSCLHSHFWNLHVQLPSCFTGSRTLPYHPDCSGSEASVYNLSPIIFGARSLDESAITHCLNDGCL